MKCPYCDYQNGYEWDGDDHVEHKGEHGDFYHASNEVTMVRNENSLVKVKDTAILHGCPSCNKTFMVKK